MLVLVAVTLQSEFTDAIMNRKTLERHHPRSQKRRLRTGRDLHDLSPTIESIVRSRPPDAQLTKKAFTKEELQTHTKRKTPPLYSHPEVSLLTFLVFERNTSLPHTMPHPQHDCHWKQHGKWNKDVPLKFVYDERGSGVAEWEFDTALKRAYGMWQDASNQIPKATFRRTTHDDPKDFLPSGHRTLRIPNFVNEISFEPRKVKIKKAGVLMPVVAEINVWQKKDGSKTITEMDLIFAADLDAGWVMHSDQTGNPNDWMVLPYHRFDVMGILVKAFGHILGLHQSDTMTHSMNGLYERDSCMKRSLECGDIRGIQSIYGKSVVSPPQIQIKGITPEEYAEIQLLS